MRYCVLGGGGSFGLAVSKYFLDKPETEQVIGVGRAPPKAPCFTLGIGDGDPRYSYHAYHITHEIDLLMALLDREKPQVFINFAAQGEGATSFEHSWRYFQTNSMGLVRFVEEICKRDYLQRFVHIGTSELYGSVDIPSKETDPIQPTSPYAVSKAAFDLYLMALHGHTKFPMNIIRPCNAYGPGQQLHRLIPKTVLCGLLEKKLPLHGGGRVEKTYIHTHDMSCAIDIVCQKAPLGEIYNVGSERPISIKGVVDLIACVFGMTFEDLCEIVGDRKHDDKRYWLDSSKIRALGWKQTVTWNRGLNEMMDWGKKYLPVLKTLPTSFVMRA